MRKRWLAWSTLAAACAAPHAAAPSADFDTTAGSSPAQVATGPTDHGNGDAGPAHNHVFRDAPPPRDAGTVVLPQSDPIPTPRDTAPDQQILVPEGWRRCTISADCAVVAAPCTSERVIAVNRKFEATMEDGVRRACGAPGPTPSEVPHCAGGRCAAILREPLIPTPAE